MLPAHSLVGDVEVLNPVIHAPVEIRVYRKLLSYLGHLIDYGPAFVLVGFPYLLVEERLQALGGVGLAASAAGPLRDRAADLAGEHGVWVVHEDAALNGELVVASPISVESGPAFHHLNRDVPVEGAL